MPNSTPTVREGAVVMGPSNQAAPAHPPAADTALRLGQFFGTSPEFWMNLQATYELRREGRRSGDRYDREIVPLPRTGSARRPPCAASRDRTSRHIPGVVFRQYPDRQGGCDAHCRAISGALSTRMTRFRGPLSLVVG